MSFTMGLQSLEDQLFYELVKLLLFNVKNISMVNSSVQLGVQNIKKLANLGMKTWGA